MPTKRIEIRWRDMDGFGHVNNSTYLTYLEEARDQYLTDVVGEAVHRVVIRRIEIDFVSGLTQDDDHVDVDVRLTGIGTSSLTLEERIVSVADGRVAATARTVMVHTDDSRAASAPWPAAARAALEAGLATDREPGTVPGGTVPKPAQ
jgi:acyl-CoA thioester hydrolase